MSTIERNCPECQSTLAANATYCGCGWGRGKKGNARYEAPELLTECAHETCQHRAKVKIHTSTGYVNLCIFHYGEHFRVKALDTCAALGLNTIEQRRECVRDLIGKLVHKWTPDYQREPGEDWSEDVPA